MDPAQRKRSVSLSSCQSVMEVNTSTIINEHNGPTFVGSNCNVSKSDGIVNLNEEIQINIQTDSAITIESNDKVPKIIVQNYGPTINLTNEVVQRLKTDGEWDNFIKVRKSQKQFSCLSCLVQKTRLVFS